MNVLIVEDDDGSRGILLEHLRARGAAVRATASVEEALDMLRREPAEVILSDIHLPGVTGTGHIRQFCRQQGAESPLVVVMTGYPTLESCLDAFQFGAWAYLVKPFKVAEFVETAERGLGERARLRDVERLEARVRALEEELGRLRGMPGLRASEALHP